jgi:hypothetical protein
VGLLPDEALVVRGGRNRPEDIDRGFGVHPSGAAGVSVESAAGCQWPNWPQVSRTAKSE